MKRRKIIRFLRKTKLIIVANWLLNVRNRFIKKFAGIRGISDIDAIYNDKFFLENLEVTKESARKTAEIVIKMFNPKSILDFGCGPGIFLKEFEKKGLEIFGVDGSKHAIENAVIRGDKIILGDLRQDIRINKKYDITLCFEVAEHIPNKHSKSLIKNITNNSELVLFTAAKKGQGGTDHINEQRPDFWIKLFNEKGFELDKELTIKIKKEMIKEKILWWIPENLMIFKKLKTS